MTKANHLINETSPYLLQHANNPVDWYPWGEAAFKKARAENKPILLSIGYAACHWCHVMAHESFENEATAKLMNENFINIKVDREERPDLDKIYQTSHYVLNQHSGGWPLTVFLTPDDLTPFFSGTYFPPTANYQLPAFNEVLKEIVRAYRENFNDIKKQNIELRNLLQHQATTKTDAQLSDLPIHLARKQLENTYDKVNGGFTGAPKFPHTTMLEFLLYDKSAMALETMHHMANGGIQDQLGGGFFRYAVDAKWEIPHFEKMLYDNASLLYVYALAANVYKNPAFLTVARNIANWVIQHLQANEGAYYASIDADSEGHEGQYYLWETAEVENLLTREEYYLIRLHYGLDQAANFENKWHLYVAQALDSISADFNIPLEQSIQLLQTSKEKLLIARNKRVAPARDEKILTSWNGLMIKGMLIAGFATQDILLIESAQRALHFIRNNLWKNQQLFACYKDGKTTLPAYLDDYAFLLAAVLTSLEIKFDNDNLQFAISIADYLLEHFYDHEHHGFYFTADNHEKLLYRPKNFMDEATPSGNAIAAHSLLLLGHLLAESKYLTAAENTLKAAWAAMTQYPSEHAALLLALKDYLYPPKMIIIRGNETDIAAWRDASKLIDNHVYAIPNDTKNLPATLALRVSHDKTCAYICQGKQCSNVIENLDELRSKI